ncbi:component of Dot/Icm secretion system. ATPase component [Candidatus Rickettsiella viridis]|uniref:Component of Dot/Icm secretion system. ATPase component n=1 Tax=Candidatus Rickettsiella viridis TaxID=676208 RepID=A0A2Z5UTZ2_9COXI|nr:type IVB secretion system coupling complex protein DotM/IcmP [Candidatus Rickettsiella viridis]BBB15106.1 component of Dot/Icm secretion system. ATPase component [Candidatus Rickettsiella viridis]
MPPSPGPQQQSGDNSLAPLWIIIALFVLGWLLWAFFHTQIVGFSLLIKSWEARLIAFFLPSVAYLPAEIKHLSPAAVAFSQLLDISRTVGEYLRYPVIAVLVVLACIIYFSHININFKKVYTMKSLTEAERQNWPQITPVVKLNLVKEDIDKGAWAMALTPMQFAKKYQLLREEKTVLTMTASAPRQQTTVQIRRDVAHHAFTLQLGDYWQGVERLKPSTKALLAIFAARANHDRDGALKLLLQIAESTKTGRLNFSGVNALWEKHKHNKAVNRVMHSHAYVLTVMASMLELARKDGVLASADFLWLKPTDRALWFMLNSVGRQTVCSEVAGPFAHWNVERAMGRRLLAPMVDEAVNGLDAAIKDILYIPDSE